MKMYPFQCPECNTVTIKSKSEIKDTVHFERCNEEYYSFSCSNPDCNCEFYDFNFSNFVRKYNPGYLNKGRCEIYKV